MKRSPSSRLRANLHTITGAAIIPATVKKIVQQKEKFLGADPNLCGQVFEAKRNRSDQVANFNLVDELIKAQVGAECDPFVLESLEKETLSLPAEPKPVYKKKKTAVSRGL